MTFVKFVFSVSTQADEAAPRVASGRAADIGHEDGGTASKGGEKRDAARNLDASDAVATRRRLDKCDGYSLEPLQESECPSSFDAGLSCDTESLNCGDLCEGDSECDQVDDNLNNCPNLVLAGGIYDMYRKVCDDCPGLNSDLGARIVPLLSSDCPATSALPPAGDARRCNGADIQCGETCESDGECGTSDDLNNCGNDGHDMYWKHCADCEYVVVDGLGSSSGTYSGTYINYGTYALSTRNPRALEARDGQLRAVCLAYKLVRNPHAT